MIKKVVITLISTSVFLCTPVFAAKKATDGCKAQDVVGSYVSSTTYLQELYNGTFRDVTYVFQLNLNAGGTVSLDWTGFNDYMISAGTGTPYQGSWTCRDDGNLLVSTIGATFFPTDLNIFDGTTVSDIELGGHNRHNRLFSVEDQDTITMRQSVRRFYFPDEDPTDPLGGTLRLEAFPDIEYTRLIPSDEGLSVLP